MFKFRSGTHGLNEELGRHRGREGKTECSLCGDECENVSHVFWQCSAYTVDREIFAFFFFRVINFRVFNFRHRRKRYSNYTT